jgi:hypothetical protein
MAPNSKFFAIAPWVAEVRIMEIITKKHTEEYQDVKKIMDLTGHKVRF